MWKYSKRDQLILLAVTSTLFPVLYLTLELPKRIINDAIGAANPVIQVWGMTFEQVTYLGILCVAFLLAVLGHGLLKMRINTMKGVLSERMLRRFRYQLIARVLRFPQPYFERVSQGELVSMVTAESEPMGGLMGDAISQPVLQAGQMLTILSFLFLQSVWFGLAAVALIPLQAWLIPKLQRQVNLLNKTRIQEVRVLAAQIGESAAGASTLRANGGWRHRMALVTQQLGRLFEIRFQIYQKKFFMKFLNNFISQLTPFLFYSVGGYLVLQGAVSLGALVAALAAYKDLSSPWKELLAYYNQTQDMSLRWDVILERFAPAGMVDEKLFDGDPEERPHLSGDIVLDHVSVRDADGNLVLDDLDVTLQAGGVIGIAVPSEEDRRALSALLTRELLPASGKVIVSGHDLSSLHQAVLAARIGHATSRPVMFQGTFGDNVMMPMRFRPNGTPGDDAERKEAIRAGNSADSYSADWLDPGLAGLEDAKALRAWWLRLIEGLGSGAALFRRGTEQRFEPLLHPELATRLVALRPKVQEAVQAAGLAEQAYLINPDLYNPALPVAENLLFATARVPVTRDLLAGQAEFLGQLRQLGLDKTLVNLTQDVIDMLRQIFGLDGTDHPLFRKLGLDPKTYESAIELIEKTRENGHALSDAELANLLAVPFAISADQIGPAFSEELKARILELRHSHSQELMRCIGDVFTPLDPATFAPGLTVLENALFGKVSQMGGTKADELRKLVAGVLIDSDVQPLVVELIYDMPVTLGGQNLSATYAEPLAFTRATIKKPDILILDQALASYDMTTQIAVYQNLRALLPDTTVIYINDGFETPDVFDQYIEVKQGRIVSEEADDLIAEDGVSSADLTRKLRALEQTPLFSGLDRSQLRLLAFGARWYNAGAGDVVFLKDDEPTDGAYVMIEGDAGLYLPKPGDEADELILTVGPGALVGELGLIRKEPRALSMVAESDITCLRIGEEEFLAVVEHDAAVAYKLLQVVAGYVSN
ncbi:ABC transporter transmembrane domain-containing protein [Ruegeria jejuensis]|uniref:ABC transporter transmembrane domain-containing protein n=1 Tax=Ruegeria jejuensis TaxID=3233338 RepID=UPI00355BB387